MDRDRSQECGTYKDDIRAFTRAIEIAVQDLRRIRRIANENDMPEIARIARSSVRDIRAIIDERL